MKKNILFESILNEQCDFSNGENFAILPISNGEWQFVAPRNWEAAKYMVSRKCCGTLGRWCIGIDKTDAYWRQYVEDGEAFVFITNRKDKYMVEIKPDGDVKVWNTEDVEEPNIEDIIGMPLDDVVNSLGDFSEIVND